MIDSETSACDGCVNTSRNDIGTSDGGREIIRTDRNDWRMLPMSQHGAPMSANSQSTMVKANVELESWRATMQFSSFKSPCINVDVCQLSRSSSKADESSAELSTWSSNSAV